MVDIADIAAIAALIEPDVKALGFELVRVAIKGGQSNTTLQIMAEDPATGQMTLEQCATLSRRLSDLLDEADPIESEYRLEVSSPGIDRPLTRPADYVRWSGHAAKVSLSEPHEGRKRLEGQLVALDGDAVRLDIEKLGEIAIPLSKIQSAKLVLTDALIKATLPLSADGADVIQEER